MYFLAPIIPGLTVALLTVVAVLPLGVSEAVRFFLPLLPMIAIHYWTVRQPSLMPVGLVFASGLAMDGLTNGPLGLWSLLYLICFALASIACDMRLARSSMGRWAEFSICIIFVCGIEWLVSMIYFARLIDWRPLAIAAIGAIAVYPLLVALFWPLNRIWSRRAPGSLVRGG